MDAEHLFAMDAGEMQTFLADLEPEAIEGVMMTLQNHVDALNEKRGVVSAVYNQKRALAVQRRKLELMSDEEQAALIQVIQAGGIKGGGKIGN